MDAAPFDAAAADAAPPAKIIFFDDFESGDINKTANGFKWSKGSSTNGSVAVASTITHSGKYALRARFLATTVDKDSSAELRFKLGSHLLP